jgi:hypothetical protein
MQFTQGSNINCTGESCGKPKATDLARFLLRQDEVFLRRSCGGGSRPAHGFASGVPEYTHASATLNDTELQKNFRRKNTARKSFLGHAPRLNDPPIEPATGRPTQQFAAHRREFRRPTEIVVADFSEPAKERPPPPWYRAPLPSHRGVPSGLRSARLRCHGRRGDCRCRPSAPGRP